MAFLRQSMRYWRLVCSSFVMADVVEVVVLVAAEKGMEKVKSNEKTEQMNILEFLEKVIIRILCYEQSHTFGALVFKFPVCKVAVLFEVDTRDCTVA